MISSETNWFKAKIVRLCEPACVRAWREAIAEQSPLNSLLIAELAASHLNSEAFILKPMLVFFDFLFGFHLRT